MKRLFPLFALIILLLFGQTLVAQTLSSTAPRKPSYSKRVVDTVKNTDPSLKGQYVFLLSRSKTINGYKLINPNRLASLWQSVNDTLRKERTSLAKANAKSAELTNKINSLQSEVNSTESSLASSNNKLNEINFLGISFAKGTYNIIVWSIILILALALFIVIARSAKNINEAKHRSQLYEEISQEYQTFKTKANEKERKLARELQDERNIIEELKNNGKI